MHVLRGVAVQPDRSRARSPRDARADRCPMLQARASHAHTRDTTRIAADSATTRARFSHTRTARRRLPPPSGYPSMLAHDVLLDKQGPLARVWLAAHWERKLNKAQLLQTSIPASVEVLVEDEFALRLCSQLLLGMVRIYARKAKYFQDDCTDALLRIKVAFQGTSVIDLSPEQLHHSLASITLPDVYTPMDLMVPEPTLAHWAVDTHTRHAAHAADITLPDTSLTLDDLPPLDAPDHAYDASTHFDLGLVDDDVPAPRPKRARRDTPRRPRVAHTPDAAPDTSLDDSFGSVGVARHASPTVDTSSHVQALLGDLPPLPDVGTPGLDAGDWSNVAASVAAESFSHVPPLAATSPAPAPASTPQRSTTPMRDVTFAEAVAAHAALTPQTAAKLRSAAAQRAAEAAPKNRKRAVHDDVTEIYPVRARSLAARSAAAAATMTKTPFEQRCLPASRTQLALMALQAQTGRGSLQRGLQMAWGDVVSCIDSLLVPPLDARRLLVSEEARHEEMQHWLRVVHDQAQELHVDEAYPAEVARRASVAEPELPPIPDVSMDAPGADKPWPEQGFDVSADLSELPPLEPMDEVPSETPANAEVPKEATPPVSPRPRRSLRHRDSDAHGTLAPLDLPDEDAPEPEDVAFEVPPENPLAMFHTRARDVPATNDWDVRTRRAAHVLRATMADDGMVSFDHLAAAASRRAAAGFFFEMLVLGTRDCVRLEQKEPYGEIIVRAVPGLAHVE